MATCKDCLHYGVCTFHITGNEYKRCPHYAPTADVVPRSEVAKEIFKGVAQAIADSKKKHLKPCTTCSHLVSCEPNPFGTCDDYDAEEKK